MGVSSSSAASPITGTRMNRISSVAYAVEEIASDANTGKPMRLRSRVCPSSDVASGRPTSTRLTNDTTGDLQVVGAGAGDLVSSRPVASRRHVAGSARTGRRGRSRRARSATSARPGGDRPDRATLLGSVHNRESHRDPGRASDRRRRDRRVAHGRTAGHHPGTRVLGRAVRPRAGVGPVPRRPRWARGLAAVAGRGRPSHRGGRRGRRPTGTATSSASGWVRAR